MKKLLRLIKRIADKIFGTKADEFYWRFRHIIHDKTWADNYISPQALDHPHRALLVEKILKYNPGSVLEIGCASGPNLVLLAQKLPNAKLEGLDVSAKAIETGRKYLKLQNIKNVNLETGNVLNLKIFPDKSFDVVFTDAVLIYVDKNGIRNVVKEFARITKKAIVLTEWNTHSEESQYVGHWAHDYKRLFKEIIPGAKIESTEITENVWAGDWSKYGNIIEINLETNV